MGGVFMCSYLTLLTMDFLQTCKTAAICEIKIEKLVFGQRFSYQMTHNLYLNGKLE